SAPRDRHRSAPSGAARRRGPETSVPRDDDQTGPGCAGPPEGDGRMADSTQNPENDASTESSEGAPPAPAGRRRRAAGAPAGAPAVTPEPVAAPEETAPRTVVAPQSEQPAEPAPA